MPSKKYQLSLFIFRRDLRLHDNTGLIEACRESKTVIPAFFFHKDLIDPNGKKFRANLIQFMLESLRELYEVFKTKGSELYFFYGDDFYKEFEKILMRNEIEAVYVNEDYTPFSRRRDRKLRDICISRSVDFKNNFDLLLTRPGGVLTGDGSPYKVFTPFYNKAKSKVVRKPVKNSFKNFYSSKISGQKSFSFLSKILKSENQYLAQRGGRSQSVKVIGKIKEFRDYKDKRDFPSVSGTTRLSAHLKFGTISVREVYWAIKNNLGLKSQLITELYWRDFYSHLSFFFPYVFGHSFNKKYENLKWENSKKKFHSWCIGKTGFPIVDAGMRQLNRTGWMHNRVRMIVASFLTKDLHIDWRWGERYFASKLVDYDPSSNNGGWQWSASTGADAQPYFRIFNPWSQQERFDPDAAYIKEWIPELRDLTPKEIHGLRDGFNKSVANYASPIVDHKIEAEKSKIFFSVI